MRPILSAAFFRFVARPALASAVAVALLVSVASSSGAEDAATAADGRLLAAVHEGVAPVSINAPPSEGQPLGRAAGDVRPAISADGQHVAYATRAGITIRRVSRRGRVVRIQTAAKSLSWSPHASRLLIAAVPAGGGAAKLVVLNVPAGPLIVSPSRLQRLPHRGGRLREASWGPSGRTVVYVAGAGRCGSIRQLSLGAPRTDRRLGGPAWPRCPTDLAFTPDGHSIIFSAAGALGVDTHDLYEAPLGNTSDVEKITDSESVDERWPAVSPSGSRLAYSRASADVSQTGIFIASRNAPALVRVATKPAPLAWGVNALAPRVLSVTVAENDKRTLVVSVRARDPNAHVTEVRVDWGDTSGVFATTTCGTLRAGKSRGRAGAVSGFRRLRHTYRRAGPRQLTVSATSVRCPVRGAARPRRSLQQEGPPYVEAVDVNR